MNPTTAFRIVCFACIYLASLTVNAETNAAPESKVVKWARFRSGNHLGYGLVEGNRIRCVSGDPFSQWKPTNKSYPVSEVEFLVPTQPKTILAAALNYKSHLGPTPSRPLPESPEFFFKPPACLVPDGGRIILPSDSQSIHFEGELVIVIGKRAKKVPALNALDYVFGITCGNDVSARDWQKNDMQWWRAKGTDTFGPCGPFIVAGINYDDLLLQTRVNGKIVQSERTSQMARNVAALVSHASRYVTLEPGDLIYTGTPGQTAELKAGDTVEVEIEHVGILHNKVVSGN